MAIFARDGETPIREVLLNAALGLRPPHHMLPPPRPILARGPNGEVLRRYFKDKLGDIIHIWRALPLTSRNLRSWTGPMLREMRAKNGVGRPPVPVIVPTVSKMLGVTWTFTPTSVEALPHLGVEPQEVPLHDALYEHGSQRAAARALGMNLSTFQRRLAKEVA